MLINKKVLSNLVQEVGLEAWEPLKMIYVEEINASILKLQNAMQAMDYEVIALEVHTLKSVTAQYGAEDALALAKSLDAKCKKHTLLASMVEEIQQLITVLGKTVTEVQQLDSESL